MDDYALSLRAEVTWRGRRIETTSIYDAAHHYHYNYHRHYDATVGRYLEADPMGQMGGTNLYLYVHAKPTRWIDPFGLDACTRDFEAALKAEERRKEAEADKLAALATDDKEAYENADKRVNAFIKQHDKAMCCPADPSTPGSKDAPARLPPRPPINVPMPNPNFDK